MTNIHTSISTLSIFAYNQIVETHDYNHLIIDRKEAVDKTQLPDAWGEIVTQYINATSHRHGAQDVIDLQKAIFDIGVTHNNVATLVFCCRQCFEPAYIDVLNSYGYDVRSKKDLNTVERHNKSTLTIKREKEFELGALMVKKNKPATFESILDKISDHKCIRLNPREITVKEWIAIEDNYIHDLNNGKTNKK